MGPQRVRHDWVTELNWTECVIVYLLWRNVIRVLRQLKDFFKNSYSGCSEGHWDIFSEVACSPSWGSPPRYSYGNRRWRERGSHKEKSQPAWTLAWRTLLSGVQTLRNPEALVELDPVSGWLSSECMHLPRQELCLGWEGSWSSAWCWEWGVPTSKVAFGLQSLEIFWKEFAILRPHDC